MASHLKIVFVTCLLFFILLEEFKPVLAKKEKKLKQSIKILETSIAKLEAKIKAPEECKACSKIKELIDTINELRESVDSITTPSAAPSASPVAGLEDSEILKGDVTYQSALATFLKPVVQSNSHWKRCWRASVDGWAAETFHSGCDDKGPTVTIVRVGHYIFGGYTSISWAGYSGARYDPSAFLFSLVNMPGWQPVKLDQTGQQSYYRYSILTEHHNGPMFGIGDISIANNASSGAHSVTNLGHTYSPPPCDLCGSSFSHSFLAGSKTFKPDEVEVFYETT